MSEPRGGPPPKRRRRRRPLREEILLLPNLITLGRIAALPGVLALIDNYSRVRSFVAAMLFLAGSISDVVDGWLARSRGLVTVVGQFLDPVADKLWVLGVLVFLGARDRVDEWLIVLLLSRELAIMGLRSIAVAYGIVIPASKGGKTKTALQVVGIVLVLVHFRYTLLGTDVRLDCQRVGTALLWISLVMSLWSFGEYLRLFVVAIEAREQADKAADDGDDGDDRPA